MATDPVEQINIEEIDSGFSTNLGASLRRMARFEPSVEVPYMTVYLDWRPEGGRPRHRPSMTIFENQGRDLVEAHPEESPARQSLERDYQRIMSFIDAGIDPAVQGVIIVANDSLNIYETFVLAMPIETQVTTGPTPALLRMAQLVEDYPPYAVLLADQQDAVLTVINRASPVVSVEIRGDDAAKRHSQGGWSQRRFQTRHVERRASFARAVAEETRRAVVEGDIGMLIVAGGDVMLNALMNEFHEEVHKTIIGTLNMDIQASYNEILEASLPLVRAREHEQELETVKTLLDEVGAGNRGVVGIDDTLKALQLGQVMTLVMQNDFSEKGWADYGLNVYGVGPIPSEHPAGGNVDDLFEVELAEELVRLTVVTDAEGEIIHPNTAAAAAFGEHQVGAILRFK